MEHKFGSGWTALKLDTLKKYLSFYTTALKKQTFVLHYIDGFAGIGQVTITDDGLERVIDGSAKIAIETDPSFDAIHLIDSNVSHAKALQMLCDGRSHCEVLLGDANRQIGDLIDRIPWRQGHRAVLFLDPYGMEVEWATLEKIATSQSIDLWFLFPLAGLYRNAPRNLAAMDDYKRAAVTRCLGTEDWMDVFYTESPQQDLFGDPAMTRTAEWDELLSFVKQRLETVFPRVAKPLILPTTGTPLFALFFTVSNPSPNAIGLSMKVANHILKAQSFG